MIWCYKGGGGGGGGWCRFITQRHRHDSSTNECNGGCREWFHSVTCCLLGYEGAQNVGLVRLRPVFLSGHNARASNIHESETVE